MWARKLSWAKMTATTGSGSGLLHYNNNNHLSLSFSLSLPFPRLARFRLSPMPRNQTGAPVCVSFLSLSLFLPMPSANGPAQVSSRQKLARPLAATSYWICQFPLLSSPCPQDSLAETSSTDSLASKDFAIIKRGSHNSCALGFIVIRICWLQF